MIGKCLDWHLSNWQMSLKLIGISLIFDMSGKIGLCRNWQMSDWQTSWSANVKLAFVDWQKSDRHRSNRHRSYNQI